jgi:hypothetical protein
VARTSPYDVCRQKAGGSIRRGEVRSRESADMANRAMSAPPSVEARFLGRGAMRESLVLPNRTEQREYNSFLP